MLLPLALSSCSRTSPASSGSTSIPSTPEAKATSEDPDNGVYPGVDLKDVLLPVGVLPKGYKAEKAYTDNSGTGLGPTVTKPISKNCNLLRRNTWVNAAGIGTAGWAEAYFTSSPPKAYVEEIDSFRGSSARTAMTRLKTYAKSCATFKDSSGPKQATFKVVMKPVRGLGEESFEIVMSARVYVSGQTTVVSREGHVIVFSICNDGSSDLGAPAIGFARKLVANVRSQTGN
ncbi:hypothetical protein ABZX95_44040 [Streptomyces sp. NPDC004232]|uniref:hypothetical protein n=1 Tax=Streptomyces sp. NPDC004232 TaxID=3154454 RepID=UPI0033B4CB3D